MANYEVEPTGTIGNRFILRQGSNIIMRFDLTTCEEAEKICKLINEGLQHSEEKKMGKHYFTFGQIHAHRVNGKTFDADSVVMIEAPDASVAREIMVENFGLKWSHQYSSLEDVNLAYYSRGVIPLREEY